MKKEDRLQPLIISKNNRMNRIASQFFKSNSPSRKRFEFVKSYNTNSNYSLGCSSSIRKISPSIANNLDKKMDDRDLTILKLTQTIDDLRGLLVEREQENNDLKLDIHGYKKI